MARILRAEYVPPSTLRVVVDLEALEELFGPRSDEVAEMLAGRVASSCLGGAAGVRRGYSHLVVEGSGGGMEYGFLERCVEEVEREFVSSRGVVEHYVLVFSSIGEMLPFGYVSYCPVDEWSRGVVYRVAGLAAHSLRRGGLECVSYGRRVVCHEGGASLPSSLEAETLLGVTRWSRCGWGYAVFDESVGRRLAGRFVSFALRDALRGRGFVVRGSGFYEAVPVYERGDVRVRRGAGFMVRVGEEGVVRLFLSPRFSIESTPLFECGEEVVGARVRSDLLDVAGWVSGCSGGGFLVDIGGYEVEVPAGRLWRVYGMEDLKRMGVAGEVLRRTRIGPWEAVQLARRYVRALGELEAAGSVFSFGDSPLPV